MPECLWHAHMLPARFSTHKITEHPSADNFNGEPASHNWLPNASKPRPVAKMTIIARASRYHQQS